MYKIIALIGEAGSGKDFLLKNILSVYPMKFNEIISCTTRPPREGEINGVNYYFLTPEEFAYKILNCKMLESTNFNDWSYGTSYDTLRLDIPNIGVFNPNGIRALSGRKDIDLYVYRLECPKAERLLRQLTREANPDVDEIIRRYQTDKEDFMNLEFNYITLYNKDETDMKHNIEQILADHSRAINNK